MTQMTQNPNGHPNHELATKEYVNDLVEEVVLNINTRLDMITDIIAKMNHNMDALYDMLGEDDD